MGLNVCIPKSEEQVFYFYVSQESLWISLNQKNIVELKKKKEVTFVQTFLLKPHCTTYSYLRPLYIKQCLIGEHWSPMIPVF